VTLQDCRIAGLQEGKGEGLSPSLSAILQSCLSAMVVAVLSVTPTATQDVLSAADVAAVMRTAVTSLDDPTLAVAVVDRTGQILAAYGRPQAAPQTPDEAVSLARTGALFSNDHAPLSSRTVRFISGIHFPPDIRNTGNAALYGIENTNRGCSLGTQDAAFTALPRSRGLRGTVTTPPGAEVLPCGPADSRGCSPGIITGKANLADTGGFDATVNPGGTPLYRNGRLLGGVGVAGVSAERAEFAAVSAAAGSGAGITAVPTFPSELPSPGAVFIDGIRLPFFRGCLTVQCVRDAVTNQRPAGSAPGTESPADYLVRPRDGQSAPELYLFGPRSSSHAGGLSASDVTRIIEQAVSTANAARAVIRLPSGQTTRMVMAVSDQDGEYLAVYRMPDAPMFSVDVAMTKARNAYYFSTREGYEVLRRFVTGSAADRYSWEPEPPAGKGWAITNRTLSYGGQPLFPPGIDLEKPATPGPWFDLFTYDTRNPCTEGPGPSRGANRAFANQSGIVWFPGSAPLYRNGELVGGLGVSGDGVEQDDFVSAGAVAGFEPPAELRVDRSSIRTGAGDLVRLPYFKFPRNPTQP
jgi:uncharacterized protein GlcG (DUF336 family)